MKHKTKNRIVCFMIKWLMRESLCDVISCLFCNRDCHTSTFHLTHLVVKQRRLKLMGHLKCMSDIRSAYNILVKKSHQNRWDVSIKMNFREIHCKDVKWIEEAHSRVLVMFCCDCDEHLCFISTGNILNCWIPTNY